MNAIGFSQYDKRDLLRSLLVDIIQNADQRFYTINSNGVMLAEFSKNFTEHMGIAVCGEFSEDDKFIYEYYYPYLIGDGVTSYEDISVERHAAKESYAGVCEEMKVGISLIFYLCNMIPYVRAQTQNQLPIKGTSVTLSGLSNSGTILMPIMKDALQKKQGKTESANRSELLAAAKKGDEEAIEILTLEDMDLYTSVSRKVRSEDVFSLVDTYFMPYGVECDQYSILGEIENVQKEVNKITGEEIFILTICCNELTFDVCINIIDLFGEPKVGRRFKGTIWLQGTINFPQNIIC